jgi:two-component system NtrC family sensor kinase
MARRHLKVLLIEDNPGDVRLIREMLAEAKDSVFHLTAAGCLAEGLAQLGQVDFDIILLDLVLPDSQGLETFHATHVKASGLPIVVLSGFDDKELAMGAVQGGAQDYLVKGQVDGHLLVRAVQYAIERERAKKERLHLLAREQEARAEVAKAEQRFRDILQGLHAIVWEADAETWRFTFVSQRAEEILGYPVERWLSEPQFWVNLIHPEDRQRSVAYCRECTAQGRDHEFEYRAIAADGRVVWLQDIVHVVRDSDGQVRQLRGVMVDISAHKQVEDELKARARQQAAVAELGQRALANPPLAELFDEAVHLVAYTLNVEYCKILQLLPDGKALRLEAGVGWKPGLIGHALVDVSEDSQAGYCLLHREPVIVEDLRTETRFRGTWLLHEHGVVSGLDVIVYSGGRPFGILSAHTAQRRLFTQDDLHFLQAIAHVLGTAIERKQTEEALQQVREDLEVRVRERTAELLQANDSLRREIAERQRAEEQLQRQQEALFQREKLAAMGSLLASVAHELNNPLSVVMVQSDLLSEEIRDRALAERIKVINESAERCVSIVQNFLALARRTPPQRTQVALNAIIEEAMRLLAYALRVDNIEVYRDLADDLPPLWADRHQLHQVLVNLITNAHQALRESPLPRQLMLSTDYDAERCLVILEVADSGPGIPAELQGRIFEPFFTTKPPGVGTGLGLPFCRGIVEAHGGSIAVQSAPGRGATFHVELPVGVTPPAGVVAPTPGLPEQVVGGAVLVVDDEPGITSALAYLLRRDGYVVDTAPNGRLALHKLQERSYDLILCDLRMPELDGPGLYRELEERLPHLLPRLIFLTGDTLSPEAREFLEKVGGARLNKPFRAADVRRMVAQALQAIGNHEPRRR